MQVMKDYTEVSIQQAADPKFVPSTDQLNKAYIFPSSMSETPCQFSPTMFAQYDFCL